MLNKTSLANFYLNHPNSVKEEELNIVIEAGDILDQENNFLNDKDLKIIMQAKDIMEEYKMCNIYNQDETVPEVRTALQNNIVFNKNEEMDLPYLAIRKDIKYGRIEYDFITTGYYQLKETIRKEIQRLFDEMEATSTRHDNRVSHAGPVAGHSSKRELNVLRKYALMIQDVIFNPDNREYKPQFKDLEWRNKIKSKLEDVIIFEEKMRIMSEI
jgi:hypothetical protein